MTSHQRGWLLPPAALALVAGVFAGRNTTALYLPLTGLILAFLAALILRGSGRFFACILFCMALGVTAGCLSYHPSLPAEDDYSVYGIVSDEVSEGSFGQVRVCLSDVKLNGHPFSGGAYWTFYTDDIPDNLLPGKAVRFHSSLYHPSGAVNPEGYDFRVPSSARNKDRTIRG